MLLKLIEQGEKMRGWQKAFFADGGKVSNEKRKELIANSKQAERQFDNTIFNIKQIIK